MTTKAHGFIALAWVSGIFVSPEALVLQGHLSGLSGLGFILPLAIALVLHGFNAAGLSGRGSCGRLPDGEIRFLADRWGGAAATFLLLMARPALAVCLATAALVSAGFVFNEVFVFWFPNFGFAALLLAGLLLINLAGPRAAAAAQLLFAATAVTALLGIALAGLLKADLVVRPGDTAPSGRHGAAMALAALAFIGYDMLRYTPQNAAGLSLDRVAWVGLVAGGLLFTFWNAAALLHVDPQRLAQTTIPHLLAAKAILGPTGRLAVGLAVIAGACAAVNALFLTVARMLAGMARQGLIPPIWGRSVERPWAALTALAAAAGLLMAAGFAGSDWLDVSIRAALLLWLVFYALVHLGVLFPERPHGSASGGPGRPLRKAGHTVLVLALITSTLLAGAVDDAPLSLLTAMALMAALAAFLAAAGRILTRWSGAPLKPFDPQLSKGDSP